MQETITEKPIVTPDHLRAIRNASKILRALNHPLRLSIILKLKQFDNRLSVTELYTDMLIEQSVASQHLSILKSAGIVMATKTGKIVHYTVNQKRIDEIVMLCQQMNGVK